MNPQKKSSSITGGLWRMIANWTGKLSAIFFLCGMGLLVSPQTTQAQIALVDNAGVTAFNNTSTSLTLSSPLTVSASANTLVVVIAWRNNSGNLTEAPSTLNWTNATTTNVLISAGVVYSGASGAHGRCVAIYYTNNPTSGSGFNTSGKLSGQVGSSGQLLAYTLSGVDTTVSPKTNVASSTTGNTSPPGPALAISFTIPGVIAGSFAAVGCVNANTDTETVTATNSGAATGTPVVTTGGGGFSSATTALLGYISGIAAGSDLFTYTMSSSGGNEAFAAAVFTPLPGPPTIITQPVPDVAFPGTSPQFTITASGTGTLSYQWMRAGTNLMDGGNISGSATNLLTISAVSAADATNNYQVIVTNSYGSVTSSVVSLSLATTNGAYEAAVLTNFPFAFYTFSETGDPEVGNVEAYDSLGVFNGTYGTGGANDQYGSGAENGADGIVGPQTTADGLIGFADTNTALFATWNNSPVDAYVSAPPFNLNNGAGTNVLTITVWIKPVGQQVHAAGIIFCRSGTTAAGLDYNLTNNNDGNLKLGYTWNNDAATFNWDSGLEAAPDIWSLVALVITPTNSTIYVINANGFQFSTQAHTNVVQKFEGPTLIGNDILNTGGLRNFEGTIDEVAFFGQALTASQMSALYAAGSGTVFLPPPPVISTQPASVSANTGQTVNFTVTASAATGYQWYYTNNAGLSVLPADSGSTDYSGSQTAALTFPNVAVNDASNYVVVVTNAYGSVTSSPAMLTVSASAATAQLRMPFMDAGPGTTTPSDTSSGGISLTMNMTTNGSVAYDLHGAPGTGVTNVNSTDTTRALDLTTNVAPTQGANQPVEITTGDQSTLSAAVTALGSSDLAGLGGGGGNITNFTATMWIKLNAAPNSTFPPPGIGPRVWILNSGSSGLDLNNAGSMGIQIFTTNTFQLGYPGGTNNFTWPSGNIPAGQWIYLALTYDGLTYRFYYGAPGSAAQLMGTFSQTGKTLALGSTACLCIGNRANSFTRGFNGWVQDFQFYNVCAGSNMVESIRASDAPLPTIPVITSQPQPASAYPGQSVSFSVTAAGGSPNSYFWRTNGVIVGADGGSFSGSTNTTLSVNPVFTGMPTNYDVVVTNSYGSATSSVAVLTILTPGASNNYTLNFGGSPIVQGGGLDWNTLNDWNPGGQAASYTKYSNPGSSYEVVSGSLLRTPLGVTNNIFPGSFLQIDGNGVYAGGSLASMGELRVKHTGINPVTNYYADLVLNGGEVLNADPGHLVLQGQLNVQFSSVFYIDSTTDSRSEEIDSWLTGSGNLFWHDNAFTNNLTNDMVIAGTANTFSGQWIVDQGALLGASANSLGTNNISVGASGLMAAVETLYNVTNLNGSLILGANGQMFLHQNDTFQSVILNGVPLPPGTYLWSQLNATNATMFPATWTPLVGSTFSAASGQIVVGNAAPPSIPHITHIGVSDGTTLSLSVTNGTPGGSWTLLQSTNLTVPLSQWQTNIAGIFDGGGNLFTNIADTATNGLEFYTLKVQ